MVSFPTSTKVQTQSSDTESYSEISSQLIKDEAEANLTNAKADDQKKLTELKESLAYNVLFFMWLWCGLMFLGVIIYFTSQLALNKEIPKEVIIGMFTATSVVVGLVGYILKGLFGGKES